MINLEVINAGNCMVCGKPIILPIKRGGSYKLPDIFFCKTCKIKIVESNIKNKRSIKAMTRAEFLGKIFDCDPRDILYPIQEPTPICRYGTCACTSCEGCKSDPSYWNAPMTLDDMENVRNIVGTSTHIKHVDTINIS